MAGEEPLEIIVNGKAYSTTMRTPGDDVELVHGLLHAEGVIKAPSDIIQIRHRVGDGSASATGAYNQVIVVLAPEVSFEAPTRATVMNSACGMCGRTSIDGLLAPRDDVGGDSPRWSVEVLGQVAASLQEAQRGFKKTGGFHGAALFDRSGDLLVVREDVGRHNAADKVIGWAMLEGALPAQSEDLGLVISSRASFELVQKVTAARMNVMVAVSGPTSMAIEAAREADLTLCAFARPPRMTIYSGEERVDLG